jgi:hypothetical protein
MRVESFEASFTSLIQVGSRSFLACARELLKIYFLIMALSRMKLSADSLALFAL